jgi:hypothetical protein
MTEGDKCTKVINKNEYGGMNNDRTDKWKEWEINTEERREEDRGTKKGGLKLRNKSFLVEFQRVIKTTESILNSGHELTRVSVLTIIKEKQSKNKMCYG